MKITSFLHDCYHSAAFWIEGEWRHLKRYWPELSDWLLFALTLSALTFVLGVSAGMMLG